MSMVVEINGPTHTYAPGESTFASMICDYPAKLYTIVATNQQDSSGAGTYDAWMYIFDLPTAPTIGQIPVLPPIRLQELTTAFFDVVHGIPFK